VVHWTDPLLEPLPPQLTKLVLPGMLERGRGVVVNIGSGNGLLPAVPLLAAYAGTKAYVNQFSRSLDAEVRPRGVRVQDQPPLYVTTKMSKIRRARLDVPTPEAWARAAVKQVGYGTATPYWYHALMLAAIAALVPDWVVTRHVRDLHVRFRAVGLRRQARTEAAAAAEALQAVAEPKKRK
jgi:17beta-estradiol 17-dehydrogenase / very-long-chain 3-oxoacyl-CoA reductase